MEHALKSLLQNNQAWARRIKKEDPEFFNKLSHQQAPQYLWIGCSDSRVPANQIIGLLPGEVFVHRNVANLVVQSDLNCLSVIQYAVDVLKVKHIMVVGHYGCGGVEAAMRGRKVGLADNWLRIVRDSYLRREPEFSKLDEKVRLDAVCEMNVVEQVRSVALSTIVQDAWARGQDLRIHGWVYGLQDGLVRELLYDISSNDDLSLDRLHQIEQAILTRNHPAIDG